MWRYTDSHADPADRDISDVDGVVQQLLTDFAASADLTEIPPEWGTPEFHTIVFEVDFDSDEYHAYAFWLDGIASVWPWPDAPGDLVRFAVTPLVSKSRWRGRAAVSAEELGYFLSVKIGYPPVAVQHYRVVGPQLTDVEIFDQTP